MAETFTIVPRGPFSLAEAIAFGFGQRDAAGDDVMRLAFCLDGYQHQVGVEVRQDEAGVHGTVLGPGGTDVAAVRQQVARVLSLDYDAAGFLQAGERDPVLRSVQGAAPGLRPPLFYSPYEAAAWAVLSVRRPPKQMMAVRERLSRAHGAVFDLAGQQLAALPAPAQMLRRGIVPRRRAGPDGAAARRRPGGAGRPARRGPPPRARPRGGHGAVAGDPRHRAVLQRPDRDPGHRVRRRSAGRRAEAPDPGGTALQLRGPVSDAELHALAEAWKPFRTWAAVLIRAAAQRVLDDEPAPWRSVNPQVTASDGRVAG